MVKNRILFVVIAFIVCIVSFTSCGSPKKKVEETIKIGTIQSLTGDEAAALGISSKYGVVLAVKEINEKGGVLGKKIELVVEDDGGVPDKALKAFEKLSDKDKIMGLIGPLKSNCSLAITKEAQKKKVIMVTHSSTNEKVTDAGDYIYRACFIDPFQGKVNSDFAISNIRAKKAAIMFDNANNYSKGLKDSFIDNFQKSGGDIVLQDGYDADETNFKERVEKLKSLKPDVLFIPDGYKKVALIAKQVKQQGIKLVMLGGDAWETISKNAGDEVKGAYYSNHFISTINKSEIKTFVQDYKKEYTEEPTAFSALAYDSMYMLAEAIERAGKLEPEKIKSEMMNTDRVFITGKIKFDQKRNPVKSAVMIKVDKMDGKLTEMYAATVEP